MNTPDLTTHNRFSSKFLAHDPLDNTFSYGTRMVLIDATLLVVISPLVILIRSLGFRPEAPEHTNVVTHYSSAGGGPLVTLGDAFARVLVTQNVLN